MLHTENISIIVSAKKYFIACCRKLFQHKNPSTEKERHEAKNVAQCTYVVYNIYVLYTNDKGNPQHEQTSCGNFNRYKKAQKYIEITGKKNPFCSKIRDTFARNSTSFSDSETKRNQQNNKKKKKRKKVCGKCNWNFCDSQGDTDNSKDKIKGNPLEEDDGKKYYTSNAIVCGAHKIKWMG